MTAFQLIFFILVFFAGLMLIIIGSVLALVAASDALERFNERARREK